MCLLIAMRLSYHRLAMLFLAAPGWASACWQEAARQHAVPATLLYAMAQAESALNPRAVNRTHYRVTKTVDIGYLQINTNSGMLRNLGVAPEQLFDPCTNIHAGARILAEKFARHGRSWEAVGAFNASCVTMTPERCRATRMRYAWRVYHFLLMSPQTGNAPAQARRHRSGHQPG
ncbi:lytic transglycosylase domain-containing protein [Pseudoduganella violacea]|uniref:Soluble lytic murein transglycosylase-like protein n=1 Tax=Pseudoduganella violacea TaxID=1715466 RepID=A0A7W5FWV0_9BURK|nr:lytic transglycosylase domain-containing protein [Pseudoduganella violacea]MBB3122182.1 soluble lytic murein transglycosylase-like protein [Pseudoduganella violacea]